MQIFTFASPLFMMKMTETRISTIDVGDNEIQHMLYTHPILHPMSKPFSPFPMLNPSDCQYIVDLLFYFVSEIITYHLLLSL